MYIARYLLLISFSILFQHGTFSMTFAAANQTSKITLYCSGQKLTTFPSSRCSPFNQRIQYLILSQNNIKTITSSMFSRLTSVEILKIDDNGLETIEPGALDNLTSLQILTLSKNRITHVTPAMFSKLKNLKQLRLDNNQIRSIMPGSFDGMESLQDLTLENNSIVEVPQYNMNFSTVTALNLAFNPITSLKRSTMSKYPLLKFLFLMNTDLLHLPARIFQQNTKLKKLYLQNTPLESIDDDAFDGVEVESLNLQGTHISHLPGKGMEFVHELNINKVKDLWELPFKSFKHLWTAHVEYHFHCCLFKQELDSAVDSTPSFKNFSKVELCPTFNPDLALTTQPPTTQTTTEQPTTDMFSKHKDNYDKNTKLNTTTHISSDKRCKTAGKQIYSTMQKKAFQCRPLPDAFNPCEDLLGTMALRVCTWFVLVLALFGNGLQLIVLLSSKRNTLMFQILMCNLSVANLLMGIYLAMLAVIDLRSFGEYQNHARAWQYGPGCNIAGFLSILSTELAVITLTIITMERYFTIVHPLKQHMHLSTKQIVILILIGWVVSLLLAILPIVGISSYVRVAICLPFDVDRQESKGYVTLLLTTNGLAFLTVLFCYTRMYCSLGGATCSNATRVESRVARKMAMLVFSNFACWFPIALFSFIAIYDSPVINVPTSKFLLVFIYPINAFTNPYLYALGTKHFQLDLLDLIRNFGLCESAIDRLRSKLLDQLTSLPNTSRVYMGSRSSVNSTMYRANSLPYNGNNPKTTTSTANGTFSSCLLSIPKFHLPSCRGESESLGRSNSCISNETSSDQSNAGHAQPLLKTQPNANGDVVESPLLTVRRLSAREVIIGGQVVNKNKYNHLATPPTTKNELHLGKDNIVHEVDQHEPLLDQECVDSLKMPVVMVTSC